MSQALEKIELRSEEVQEILSKVPHWMIRWGNTLFLLLIITLLVISWFVKYPDIISSEVLITTRIPPEKEYAKTTGKLEAIFVSNNENINIDEPIAIIENTASYKDVFMLKSIIDTITIDSKSFSFPIDSFPTLFLGEIGTNYALFENSYIQYKLNKSLRPFSNEKLTNKSTISELKIRLQTLQSQKEINQIELEIEKRDLQRNKIIFEKGIISAQEFEGKQLEYAQAERNYKNFESSISQIREALSDANNALKGTDINRVKEEVALLNNVIQSFNQLKNAIKDWEYLYVFKTNINGKVAFLNFWNTGQTVEQGDLIFTVIPSENSTFIGKVKSPAQNSAKIKPNQIVNIKLENYPASEFGTLQGRVKSISLIPDDLGMYAVDIELPEELITSYDKEIDFKQEMRGIAEIVTEDLRLIERFFYQIRTIFTR